MLLLEIEWFQIINGTRFCDPTQSCHRRTSLKFTTAPGDSSYLADHSAHSLTEHSNSQLFSIFRHRLINHNGGCVALLVDHL